MSRNRKSKDDQENSLPPPPDQGQRDLIRAELGKNVLVEAAAGTGKTSSMVGRMVALLRAGRCEDIRNLVAVTFTRKAAAELRSRFRIELEKAAHGAGGEERERLERALANIEQCFVGTIHSFCARLLRERPVEADVDLAFEEIDEIADMRLRKEAWNESVARILVNDPRGILVGFDRLGLRVRDLEDTFIRFADFPDVDEWPVQEKEFELPDLDGVIEEIRGYVEHMSELGPRLPAEWGNDELIPAYIRLPRVVSHYEDLKELPRLMEVLGFFDKKAKIVQKEWKKNGEFTADQAKEEGARWDGFREVVVRPALRAWNELRYESILELMFETRDIYDELRKERGLLNYQDLLMKAAGLLSDKPHVRRYFRNRFTHVLVDEFQDTDPVQAEVMLLLTANDVDETDWRKCSPSPGSLFVVGDPKQSIYRFRRADIVTYNEVKDIIGRGGGKGENGLIIQLPANFRAGGPLIKWANDVFEPGGSEPDEFEGKMLRFPEVSSVESPSYVALEKGRVDGNEGRLSGLFTLRVLDEYVRKDEAIDYEADLIARTIRHALDSGMTVTRTVQQVEGGMPERVSPSDFMIITRNRANLSVYASKLQEYGIPHQVTGGSALNEVDELKLLHACMDAVVYPDNPVALVGALRSELFGTSDAALYAFKKAGGRFSYNAEIPAELPKEDSAPFRDAFDRMKKYSLWLARVPPVAALEKIVADLGLMALAGARGGGDVEAGSLAKAIEVLRSAQHDMWTVAQIMDYLGELVEMEEPYDGISARSEEKPAVRVMNLHKVKGLEAPVVFLADPSGEFDHPVDLHIDRSGNRILGYMAAYGRKRGHYAPLLAHPEEWETLQERERRFLVAEQLRLRYVAATRAGSAMIITQRMKGNHNNPWKYFEKHLPSGSEILDPGPQSPPPKEEEPVPAEGVRGACEGIAGRLAEAERPTYDARGAKEYALSVLPVGKPGEAGPSLPGGTTPAGAPLPEEGEHGVEWGMVIHGLLELAMKNPRADLERLARALLPEHGLKTDLIDAVTDAVKRVKDSGIWQRALSSRRQLTEVPFQFLLEEEDSLPAVLRGCIDLIFEEDDGWVLVDYKTDILEGKRLDTLVTKYSPQVRLYAEAWERCTGEPVKEAVLYFLRADSLVPVSGE